jgi:hypothetical protein
MSKKIYCNACGSEMRVFLDEVICDECGNYGWIEDDGSITQMDDGEFHSDADENAIGTSDYEAELYSGDFFDEDDD